MHPNNRSQGWRHGDNRNNSNHQRNSGGNRWGNSNDRYYGGGTGNHNYNSSSNYNNPSHYGRNSGQQDAGYAASASGGGWNSEREGRVAESSHKSKRPGDAASSAPVETATAASATTTFFGFDASTQSQNKRPKTSETVDLRLITTTLPSQPLPPTQDATLEDLFASSCTIGTPPDEEANKAAFVECLREMDRCLDFVSEQAHQLPIGWAEKKQAAAEKTIRDLGSIQRAKRSTQHLDYYDHDDSDDSLPPGCSAPSSTPEIGLSVDEKRFINALPFCIPLSAGFHVLRPDASEICFCPCGPNLTPWREKFNLHFDGICGKHTKKFTPNALMDHLKMEGGCYEAKSQGKMGSIELKDIYHHATRIYLQNLYADYFGKDYDHKALHPCQSKEFQRAVNEEMRLMERAVVLGMRENRKVQEENEKLREENKKLSLLDEDRRNAIERYEELLKRFNVEKRDTTQDALTDHQLAKFKRITSNYFEMNKGLQGTLNDGVVKLELRSMAKGAVGFSLQTFFDESYVSEKKYLKTKVNASSVLFEDDANQKIAKAILSNWEIIYDKQGDYSDSKGTCIRIRSITSLAATGNHTHMNSYILSLLSRILP